MRKFSLLVLIALLLGFMVVGCDTGVSQTDLSPRVQTLESKVASLESQITALESQSNLGTDFIIAKAPEDGGCPNGWVSLGTVTAITPIADFKEEYFANEADYSAASTYFAFSLCKNTRTE